MKTTFTIRKDWRNIPVGTVFSSSTYKTPVYFMKFNKTSILECRDHKVRGADTYNQTYKFLILDNDDDKKKAIAKLSKGEYDVQSIIDENQINQPS